MIYAIVIIMIIMVLLSFFQVSAVYQNSKTGHAILENADPEVLAKLPCFNQAPIAPECCKHGEFEGMCMNKETTHVFDPRQGIWTKKENICDKNAPRAPNCCRNGMFMGLCLNEDRKMVYDKTQKKWISKDSVLGKECSKEKPVGESCCTNGQMDDMCFDDKKENVFDYRQGKWISTENACNKSSPRAPECCRQGMYMGMCLSEDLKKVYDPSQNKWVPRETVTTAKEVDANTPSLTTTSTSTCNEDAPVGEECCKYGMMKGLCMNENRDKAYDPMQRKYVRFADICLSDEPRAPECCINGKFMGMCVNKEDTHVYDPAKKIWTQKKNVEGGEERGAGAAIVDAINKEAGTSIKYRSSQDACVQAMAESESTYETAHTAWNDGNKCSGGDDILWAQLTDPEMAAKAWMMSPYHANAIRSAKSMACGVGPHATMCVTYE